MFETMTSFTVNLSLFIGSLLGVFLHFKYGRPRTEKGFCIALVGFLFSPTIGINTYIIGSGTLGGTTNGICLAPFLFSLLGVLSLCFIVKYIKVKNYI